MAHIPEGVFTEKRELITAASVRTRTFTYEFQAGGANDAGVSDLRVSIAGGAPISQRLYRVTPNQGGRGGTIYFRVNGEDGVTNQVNLIAGQEIRIYRDTTIARSVVFGGKGYAPASAVEAFAAKTTRTLEELSEEDRRTRESGSVRITDVKPFAREGGQIGSTGITGNDVAGAVKDFAREGLDPEVKIARGDLGSALQAEIDAKAGTTHSHDTDEIANGAVTTPKIADNAVTTAKIAAGAVGTTDLANDAVTSAKIADNAVGTDQIAPDAVSIDETDFGQYAMDGRHFSFDTGTRKLHWRDFADGTDQTVDIPGGSQPDASETVKGIIEIADQTEGRSGTDDKKALTSQRLADYLDNVWGPARGGLTASDTGRMVVWDESEEKWDLSGFANTSSSAGTNNVTFYRDATTGLWQASAPAGGGGDANTLEPLSTVPAIAGYEVNDLINVQGELYRLVDDDDQSNLLAGVPSRINATYVGVINVSGTTNDRGSFSDPAYEGEVSWAPEGVDTSGVRAFRVRLPNTAVSSSVTEIWMDIEQHRLSTANGIRLIRDTGRDTSTLRAYRSADQTTRIDVGIGVPFTARFYSNAARTTPLDVHAVDRWEKAEHVNPQQPETVEGVYPLIKQILRPGHDARIAADDDAHTLSLGVQEVQSGTTFPSSPSDGDHFELTAQTTHAFPGTLHVERSRNGIGDGYGWLQGSFGKLDFDPVGGLTGIIWWDNTSTVPLARRRRLYVYTGGANARVPNRITIAGSHHTLTSVAGSLHLYQTPAIANPLAADSEVVVQVRYTTTVDGSNLAWPDKTYEPHLYAYDGPGQKWRKASALSAADIRDELASLTGADRLDISAIKGNVAARFQRIIQEGPGRGLAVNSISTDANTDLVLFDPVFDLDDVQRGTFRVEARLSIPTATRSNANIGFGSGHATAARLDDDLFASTLRDSAVYAATTEDGVEIGTGVDVYQGASVAGTVHVYLARNAANQVGYHVRYVDNDQTSGVGNFNLAVLLDVAWNPADAADAQSQTITASLRGPLRATSSVLPTAVTADEVNLRPTTGWTIAPGAGALGYYRAGGLSGGIQDPFLGTPTVAPSGANGIWVVSKVAGVERHAVFMPWGPGVLTDEGSSHDADAILFFQGGPASLGGDGANPRRCVVRWRILSTGYSNVLLFGDGTALPAMSTVEVYEAGVELTGLKGDKGDPGAPGAGGAITFENDGSALTGTGNVDRVNFNTGLTATRSGTEVTVNATATGGGLSVEEDGTRLGTAGTVDTINAAGGIRATRSGNEVALEGFSPDVLAVNRAGRNITAAQAAAHAGFELQWENTWQNSDQVVIPMAGIWTIVNWAFGRQIQVRGSAAGRRTVWLQGNGDKAIVNVTGSGDCDLVTPLQRTGSVNVTAGSGTQAVTFSPRFAGTGVPVVVGSASTAAGAAAAAVTSITATGFNVARAATAYRYRYIATRAS